MNLAFPKPKDSKKPPKPAVKVYRDGRECCNMLTKAGRDEYSHRVDIMFDNQGKRCGLRITPQCLEKQGRWPRSMMQFGHPRSRGGGKRDDRISIDGKPSGAAALCPFCNIRQGSRPIKDFVPDCIP
jgi:hypothetical protein